MIAPSKERLLPIMLALLSCAAGAALPAESQPVKIRAMRTFSSCEIILFLPDFMPVRDAGTGQLLIPPNWILRNAAGAAVRSGRFAFN